MQFAGERKRFQQGLCVEVGPLVFICRRWALGFGEIDTPVSAPSQVPQLHFIPHKSESLLAVPGGGSQGSL